MEKYEKFWQQFTQSGNPLTYLAYKQSRQQNEPKKEFLHHITPLAAFKSSRQQDEII